MERGPFIWFIALFQFLSLMSSPELPDFSEFYQKNKTGGGYLVSSQQNSPPQEMPEYMRIRNRLTAMMATSHSYYVLNEMKAGSISDHWQEYVLLQLSGKQEELLYKKKMLESELKKLWMEI